MFVNFQGFVNKIADLILHLSVSIGFKHFIPEWNISNVKGPQSDLSLMMERAK